MGLVAAAILSVLGGLGLLVTFGENLWWSESGASVRVVGDVASGGEGLLAEGAGETDASMRAAIEVLLEMCSQIGSFNVVLGSTH